MRTIWLVFVIVGLLFISSSVSAQELRPDDRYKGYPQVLIEWPKDLPDLNVCQELEYYEPSDVHLAKYASWVRVSPTPRIQDYDECRWMLTRNKWRWVLRPAGTRHIVDARGRDLFDGGSPTGKECDNPSPFGFAIRPRPQAAIEQPPPPPQVRQEAPPLVLSRLPPPAPAMVPQPPQLAPMFQPFVPEPEPVRSSGRCGKKCMWTLGGIGGALVGYEAWRNWPCPPGQGRR